MTLVPKNQEVDKTSLLLSKLFTALPENMTMHNKAFSLSHASTVKFKITDYTDYFCYFIDTDTFNNCSAQLTELTFLRNEVFLSPARSE